MKLVDYISKVTVDTPQNKLSSAQKLVIKKVNRAQK